MLGKIFALRLIIQIILAKDLIQIDSGRILS